MRRPTSLSSRLATDTSNLATNPPTTPSAATTPNASANANPNPNPNTPNTNANTNTNTNPNNNNNNNNNNQAGGNGPNAANSNLETNKDITMYRAVLRNELLGTSIDGLSHQQLNQSQQGQLNTNLNSSAGSKCMSVLQPRDMTSVFQYGTSPFKSIDENISASFYHTQHSPYSLSPLSASSQKLLRSPRKPMRKIPKVPFKVLDAPELQDDFYLNLVDWSSTNVLGVGLGTSVYLWSACTSQVTKLCDLANREDSVSSVSWSEKGNYIAVGTFKGDVQIWDAAASKLLNTLNGHTARVGALAWNHDLLCSGSRDRNVFLRDIRVPAYEGERKLTGHKQEVCGLKWSPDHQLLASGGNDNKLLVWNVNGGNTPIQTYNDHIAAVKAIAWSPHQHGLLASGGGTADRCIRFWNTLTGQNLQYVDTGSQVCNLAWSKHSNELVSTHGYSQNQILIWKYPSMVQLAKLTGHSYRVLYLAVSPDGEAIVTGAGDETLRFWNVFNKSRCTKESKSALNLFGKIR